MLELFFRCLRGEDLYIAKLADEYAVSAKSISRSISDLKSFLADHRELVGNAELQYDYQRKCYRLYMDEFLTNKELFALVEVLIGARAFSKMELLELTEKLKRFTTTDDRPRLQELIRKEMYQYPEVKHDCESVSDPDTMSIFRSSKILGYEDDMILGPTGATGVPEFNTRFMRQMLIDVQPQDFRTLIHMSGFGHGTDVWLGNAKDLVLSGTASALETIACRDDIMLYLISKGLDRKMSYQIMEAVRKGKIRKCGFELGWLEELEVYDVPEWYIESLTKIGYLFPKAHATAYVSMAFRIAWYKVHTPLAFYAAYFTMQQNTFDIRKCCFFDAQVGLTRMRELIEEIDSNRDATIAQQDSLKILELCYEFYLRGFHFEKMHEDQETNPAFTIVDNGLRVAPQYVGE